MQTSGLPQVGFARLPEVSFGRLPEVGFVRLPQILSVIPVSRSTWWAGVKSGRYPEPVRTLGERVTAWKAKDILDLIERLGDKHGCGDGSQ